MTLRRRWDWLGIGLGAWFAAAIAVAIEGYFKPFGRTVFDIYATAAREWWIGADMYVFHREWFRYSPLFAIAISPFALLPDGLGNGLWKLFNAVLFAGGVAVWLRYVVPHRPTRAVAGVAILLTLPGSMHSLHIGQANLTMMALAFFGLAAAARERWWLAAACLAGATLIKGYPIALAMLVAIPYFRAFAWRYSVAMAAGLLLPFLFQSPSVVAFEYRSWFHHLGASGTELNRERERTLANLFQAFGFEISPELFLKMGALAGLAVAGLVWWIARRTQDRRTRLNETALLFSIWVALFCPSTESCTYAMLAPFAAWLFAGALERRAWGEAAIAGTALVLSGPSATDLFGPWVRTFTNSHGVQQIGGLVLLAYALARLFVAGRVESSSRPGSTTVISAPELLHGTAN